MNNGVDIEELRKKIKVKYPHESFYARNFGSFAYKEYNEINDSIYTERHKIEGLKIYKNKNIYIAVLTGSIFFLLTFPVMFKGEENRHLITFLYLFCPVVIIYSIYVLFFKRDKIFLEVTEKALLLNGKTSICWEDILVTGILTVKGKHSDDYVLLGLSTGEILKIETSCSYIIPRDFIKIIHLKKQLNKL